MLSFVQFLAVYSFFHLRPYIGLAHLCEGWLDLTWTCTYGWCYAMCRAIAFADLTKFWCQIQSGVCPQTSSAVGWANFRFLHMQITQPFTNAWPCLKTGCTQGFTRMVPFRNPMEHCKYANSGSWDVVSDDVVWNSHLDLFVDFCRVWTAIDVGRLCRKRTRHWHAG